MPESILPFLMFQGQCEEAINFYLSTIPGSKVDKIEKFTDGPAPGKIMKAALTLCGQTFLVNDSPIPHAFTFTPSHSFFVTCSNVEEQKKLFEELSKGGGVLMPLSNYGFSQQFAWVNDKFGVSWQLNLP